MELPRHLVTQSGSQRAVIEGAREPARAGFPLTAPGLLQVHLQAQSIRSGGGPFQRAAQNRFKLLQELDKSGQAQPQGRPVREQPGLRAEQTQSEF